MIFDSTLFYRVTQGRRVVQELVGILGIQELPETLVNPDMTEPMEEM